MPTGQLQMGLNFMVQELGLKKGRWGRRLWFFEWGLYKLTFRFNVSYFPVDSTALHSTPNMWCRWRGYCGKAGGKVEQISFPYKGSMKVRLWLCRSFVLPVGFPTQKQPWMPPGLSHTWSDYVQPDSHSPCSHQSPIVQVFNCRDL